MGTIALEPETPGGLPPLHHHFLEFVEQTAWDTGSKECLTLGQLTAAIAHEVNQPLTGILANAQAARRFLESPTPDLAEIRAILDDIVEDDRRAGRVLERLRSMLRRRDPELMVVDGNQLVVEVVRFLHSDAVIRNIAVDQKLDPALPFVRGDAVQLGAGPGDHGHGRSIVAQGERHGSADPATGAGHERRSAAQLHGLAV